MWVCNYWTSIFSIALLISLIALSKLSSTDFLLDSCLCSFTFWRSLDFRSILVILLLFSYLTSSWECSDLRLSVFLEWCECLCSCDAPSFLSSLSETFSYYFLSAGASSAVFFSWLGLWSFRGMISLLTLLFFSRVSRRDLCSLRVAWASSSDFYIYKIWLSSFSISSLRVFSCSKVFLSAFVLSF